MLRLLFAFCLIAALVSEGISFEQHESRIVGGMPARKGQFPYQISIRDRSNHHLCSGAKLSRRWVVTTASCMGTNIKFDGYTMVAGALFSNTGGTPFDVESIIEHPRFNFNTLENDIALLYSRFDMPDANIASAPIAIANFTVEAGTNATVAGWGALELGGGVAPMLNWALVETLEPFSCSELMPSSVQHLIHENQICAIGRAPFGGNCYGDGGNPLAIDRQLVGLASFGISCATGHPDVYTFVPDFIDWITEVTGIVYEEEL